MIKNPPYVVSSVEQLEMQLLLVLQLVGLYQNCNKLSRNIYR